MEAGWTHVPAKKGRRNRVVHPGTDMLSQVDRDATVDSLQAELQKHKSSWTSSTNRKQMYDSFKNLSLYDRPPISRALCFGLGSFVTSNLTLRERSMLQLALFLDVAEHLKGLHNSGFDMYAQEPQFKAMDKDFLASLGISTLEIAADQRTSDDLLQLGPNIALLDERAFVADCFVDWVASLQFVNLRLGLLVSPLPRLLETGPGPLSENTEMYKDNLQKCYRWYKLQETHDGHMAWRGLYVCSLKEDDDAVES